MPRSRNRLDGREVYFEDEGGDGVPVVFHGGFLDSVADVQESKLAQALPPRSFVRIYVDHRGLGASDKPHDPAAYAMAVRVGDAVGVLDELSIERAHFVGMSWGGRLGFGIGEHAPERVLSLVIGGQQPYEWPDSPLTRAVSQGLATARSKGAKAVVEALEAFWDVRFPDERRERWVANDAAALDAAWTTALAEGPVSQDLRTWQVPCLIFLGATDTDFLEQAQRAAQEIPTAEFIALGDADHYVAHTSPDELLSTPCCARCARIADAGQSRQRRTARCSSGELQVKVPPTSQRLT